MKKGEMGFPAATWGIAMGAARRSLGSRHGGENTRNTETSVSLIVGGDPSKAKGKRFLAFLSSSSSTEQRRREEEEDDEEKKKMMMKKEEDRKKRRSKRRI
jgi:hypothetical protein